MALITIDDDGYNGEQLARITTDAVRWRSDGYRSGEKIIPGKDIFEEEMALAALLANEVVFLNTHHWMKDWPAEAKATTALCVNCSDVFAWGCSDAERMELRDLPELYDMWVKDHSWGSAVWCMVKRNQMPQPPVERDIRKAGIWDLDALKLGDNWQDAEVSRMLRAISAAAASVPTPSNLPEV